MIQDNADRSMYEILSDIVSDSKVLWFEIVGDYSAVRKFESFAQAELGERGIGEAKTMRLSKKLVSGCGTDDYKPDNLVVTMLRDASTRNDSDAYAVTTRIVASLSEKQRIHAVKVCFRGEKGYQTINLRNRFMFPELSSEEKDFLAEELYAVRILESQIAGADNRIKSLKDKCKDKTECNGLTYEFKKAEGVTENLCDENGLPVKRENKTLQTNGVCLVPSLILTADKKGQLKMVKFTGYKSVEFDSLPMLVWERDQMREQFKERMQNIRWMELSVIERMDTGVEQIVFGQQQIEFHIVRSSNTVYDYTPEVLQKIKDKVYTKKLIPVKNGKWVLSGEPKKIYSLATEMVHA